MGSGEDLNTTVRRRRAERRGAAIVPRWGAPTPSCGAAPFDSVTVGWGLRRRIAADLGRFRRPALEAWPTPWDCWCATAILISIATAPSGRSRRWCSTCSSNCGANRARPRGSAWNTTSTPLSGPSSALAANRRVRRRSARFYGHPHGPNPPGPFAHDRGDRRGDRGFFALAPLIGEDLVALRAGTISELRSTPGRSPRRCTRGRRRQPRRGRRGRRPFDAAAFGMGRGRRWRRPHGRARCSICPRC